MILLIAALTLHQAVSAFEAGRLGEAQAALAQLASAQPRDADVLTWLAAARLENQGDAAGAEDLLEKDLALDPQSWRAHMLLGVSLAKRIGGASIFQKISLAGRMKSEFERAVALAPDSPDARAALLRFYLHAPGIAGGGVDKAREEAARIGRAHRSEGLLARAQIAAAEGEPSAVLFEQAAAAATDDATRAKVLTASAEELARRKEWAKALAAARAAAGRRPQDPLLRARLGKAQIAAGDAAAGIESLRLATSLDPALAEPWYLLGAAFEREDRRTEARAAYAEFVRLAPRHPATENAREKLDSLR